MALDMYMSLAGAPGEAQSVSDLRDIRGRTLPQVPFEILSFSWGVTNPVTFGSGAGGTTGRPSLSALSVKKRVDKASVPLLKGALAGQVFKTGLVLVARAGETRQAFEQYDLTNVYVESVQSGADDGEDSPLESVTFTAVVLRFSYALQNPDGSPGVVQTVEYDQSRNVVVA